MYIKFYRVFREHMSHKEHVHTKDHSAKIAVSLNLFCSIVPCIRPALIATLIGVTEPWSHNIIL